MRNVLVIYFSASGRTKQTAQIVAKLLNCESYKIKPKTPYTHADLNWMDRQSRSTIEMENPSSRPEIITGDIDLSQYDTILIGFPIWRYIAPHIVNSFLESYNFSGKTVIPFATSGSSGYGNSNKSIKESLGENVVLKDGTMLNNDQAIQSFVESLKF